MFAKASGCFIDGGIRMRSDVPDALHRRSVDLANLGEGDELVEPTARPSFKRSPYAFVSCCTR